MSERVRHGPGVTRGRSIDARWRQEGEKGRVFISICHHQAWRVSWRRRHLHADTVNAQSPTCETAPEPDRRVVVQSANAAAR